MDLPKGHYGPSGDTKECQALNFQHKALTVNPAKTCQPLGAVLCALGFEKTLAYVHGSQGCVAYFRTYFNRRFRFHGRRRGGLQQPEEHVRWSANAKALYKLEMIASRPPA